MGVFVTTLLFHPSSIHQNQSDPICFSVSHPLHLSVPRPLPRLRPDSHTYIALHTQKRTYESPFAILPHHFLQQQQQQSGNDQASALGASSSISYLGVTEKAARYRDTAFVFSRCLFPFRALGEGGILWLVVGACSLSLFGCFSVFFRG